MIGYGYCAAENGVRGAYSRGSDIAWAPYAQRGSDGGVVCEYRWSKGLASVGSGRVPSNRSFAIAGRRLLVSESTPDGISAHCTESTPVAVATECAATGKTSPGPVRLHGAVSWDNTASLSSCVVEISAHNDRSSRMRLAGGILGLD